MKNFFNKNAQAQQHQEEQKESQQRQNILFYNIYFLISQNVVHIEPHAKNDQLGYYIFNLLRSLRVVKQLKIIEKGKERKSLLVIKEMISFFFKVKRLISLFLQHQMFPQKFSLLHLCIMSIKLKTIDQSRLSKKKSMFGQNQNTDFINYDVLDRKLNKLLLENIKCKNYSELIILIFAAFLSLYSVIQLFQKNQTFFKEFEESIVIEVIGKLQENKVFNSGFTLKDQKIISFFEFKPFKLSKHENIMIITDILNQIKIAPISLECMEFEKEIKNMSQQRVNDLLQELVIQQKIEKASKCSDFTQAGLQIQIQIITNKVHKDFQEYLRKKNIDIEKFPQEIQKLMNERQDMVDNISQERWKELIERYGQIRRTYSKRRKSPQIQIELKMRKRFKSESETDDKHQQFLDLTKVNENVSKQKKEKEPQMEDQNQNNITDKKDHNKQQQEKLNNKTRNKKNRKKCNKKKEKVQTSILDINFPAIQNFLYSLSQQQIYNPNTITEFQTIPYSFSFNQNNPDDIPKYMGDMQQRPRNVSKGLKYSKKDILYFNIEKEKEPKEEEKEEEKKLELETKEENVKKNSKKGN